MRRKLHSGGRGECWAPPDLDVRSPVRSRRRTAVQETGALAAEPLGRWGPWDPRVNCNEAVSPGVLEDVEHPHIQEASRAADLSEVPVRTEDGDSGVELSGFRERSLQRGVNPVLYWT